MKTGYILKAIVLIIVITVIFLLPRTPYAKESIDVVLAIDSSGSMKKTDPMSLRIPAAKLFISLLEENDRAAVISFSGSSDPLIDLTLINNEDNKQKLLEATEKITSDGLHTNLYNAMDRGLEMLSRDKSDRSKIIVLMSDGMMDVGDPVEDRILLDRIKTDLMAVLKKNTVKVYTIAFTDQSDRKLLEKVSKRTGGFYNLARTDKDLHLIFTSIFESLKTPEMLPMVKNEFIIDNSIEEVTIVATKESHNTSIQIKGPEDQRYIAEDKNTGIKWFESNKFDMITVKTPAEGKWEILFSTGENNKAYIITNLKLQTNFDKLYTTYGKPLDIKVWLEKDGNTIKEEEVLETIDIYMEVTKPDGKLMRLKPFNKGEGLFLRRLAPFKAGNYQMKIIAKGKTFEREKVFIFNVAGVTESKEDIAIEREEKKMKEMKEKGEKAESPAMDEEDPVQWGKVIIQFVLINLLLVGAGFAYLKRKKLRDLLGRIKRKKGGEKAEEQQTAQEGAEIKEKEKEETIQEDNQVEETEGDEEPEEENVVKEQEKLEDESAEKKEPEAELSKIELEDEDKEESEEQSEPDEESKAEESTEPEEVKDTDREEALQEQESATEEQPKPDEESKADKQEETEEVKDSDWEEAMQEQESATEEQSKPDEESKAEEQTEAEEVKDSDWAEAMQEQESATGEQSKPDEESKAEEQTEAEEVKDSDWAEAMKEQESATEEQPKPDEESKTEEPVEAEEVKDSDWAEAMKEQESATEEKSKPEEESKAEEPAEAEEVKDTDWEEALQEQKSATEEKSKPDEESKIEESVEAEEVKDSDWAEAMQEQESATEEQTQSIAEEQKKPEQKEETNRIAVEEVAVEEKKEDADSD